MFKDLIGGSTATFPTASNASANQSHYPLDATEFSVFQGAVLLEELSFLVTATGQTLTNSNSATAHRQVYEAVLRLSTPQGYIYGLTIANNTTDPANDIDFSIGTAKDSANLAPITLGSALTKRLDGTFATGNNNGGLFTGSKANNTTYFAFAIRNPSTGAVDCGFDTDFNAGNRPVAFSRFRRLGAFTTDGSGNIRPFNATGNGAQRRYELVTPVTEASAGAVTSAATVTLAGLPTGITLTGLFGGQWGGANSGPNIFYAYPQDSAVAVARFIGGQGVNVTDAGANWQMRVPANGQIKWQTDLAVGTVTIETLGWIDWL